MAMIRHTFKPGECQVLTAICDPCAEGRHENCAQIFDDGSGESIFCVCDCRRKPATEA